MSPTLTSQQLQLAPLWDLYSPKKFNCHGIREYYVPGDSGWVASPMLESEQPLNNDDVKLLLITAHEKGAISVCFVFKHISGVRSEDSSPDFKISRFIIPQIALPL